MLLFFALLFVATAFAGLCALAIFLPLLLVHLRDRHPGVRDGFGEGGLASPAGARWLLAARYRALGDPGLNGLAMPTRWAVIVVVSALGLAALLGLASKAVGA